MRFELRNAEWPEAQLVKLNASNLLFELTEETEEDQIEQVVEAARVLQEADVEAVAEFCGRKSSWGRTG